MKDTVPIVMCDDESGCDEWFLDRYEMCVDNWRDFVPKGWEYDPYDRLERARCPEHAANQQIPGAGRVG